MESRPIKADRKADRQFIHATPEQKDLVLACAKIHPRHIELNLDKLESIRTGMVQAIPYDGPVDRFISVLLGAGTKQGSDVGPHAHKGWTAVWYPFGADTIIIENIPYHPEPEEVIVLAPGVVHEVPYTDKERLSIAVVVATPEGAG